MRLLAACVALVCVAPLQAAAATGDPEQFREAFRQVRVGMTLDDMRRLGQIGNGCTNWTQQRPPVCGPLHYFHDVHTSESGSETITIYDYGDGQQIILKDGAVVMIRR
jgi:hypothetical protein